MQERKRGPQGGDIHGASHGDPSARLRAGFTDWNNPEDEELEDTPEGYYDDEVDDDSCVPDEDDPDYDLSEEAGYAGWDSPKRETPFPQWLIVAASLLLILAILAPILIRFG